MDITDTLFDPIMRKFEDLSCIGVSNISINISGAAFNGITIQTNSGKLLFSDAPGADFCNIISISGLSSSFIADDIVDCHAEVSVLDTFLVRTCVRFTNQKFEDAEIVFEADYPVKLFEVVTC